MTNRLTIRQGSEADAEGCAALLGELGYPTTPLQARDRLRRMLDDRAVYVLVGERSGVVMAIAVALFSDSLIYDDPCCTLDILVVAERARRCGIGRAVVGAVEDEARRRGCTRITLVSGDWRGEAHEFYRALAYEHVALGFDKPL